MWPWSKRTRTESMEEVGEISNMTTKGKQAEPQHSMLLLYVKLLAFARATWIDSSLLITGAVCAAASGVPFPLMAIIFGQLVDDINGAACEADRVGNGEAYGSAVDDKVLQLTYISIAALALIFVYLMCWNIFSQRLAFRLRDQYFESLLRQDQTFIDEHQAGKVSSRLNRDIQTVQSGTGEKVGMIIASFSFFITAYIVAFTRQARLTGMLISLIPAFLLVAIVGGAFFQKHSVLMTDAATRASNIAAETLSHISVVKSFTAGPRLESKYAEEMQASRTHGIRKGAVAALQAGCLYFIAYSANALAFWQGSRMIARLIDGMATGRGGGSSVGQIYTVVFILVDACVILGTTAPFFPLLGAAAVAFEGLKKDIDHKSTIDGTAEEGKILLHNTPGEVEFRNVSFAYPSRREHPVLRSVDLKFPAEIFNSIQRAAELADAHNFIKTLHTGYKTVIGPNGQALSGGQKQRVAIARALIRDPRILILDEATASLDSMSEQRVQRAIDRLAGSRTIISIAHRLSTIRNADNIVVLSGCAIVDQGTYDELSSRPGVFSDMVKAQSLESWTRSEDAELEHNDNTEKISMDINFENASEPLKPEKNISSTLDPSHTKVSSFRDREERPRSTGSEGMAALDSSLPTSLATKTLARYCRPQLWWLLMAMFAGVIVGLTFTAAGLIFGHTVGSLTPCNTTVSRIIYLGNFFGSLLFMVASVELLANFTSWSSFALISERLLYTLRVLSFRSLLERSLQWHQTKVTSPSELLSVITKDCAAIAGFSGSTVGTLFSITVNFLVAIVLSHIIAWKIAVVCLAMVPILLGTGIMQLRSHSRHEERSSKAFAKAVGISTEAITLFKTIATFSLEDQILRDFRQALSVPREQTVVAGIYTNIWLAISNSAAFFVYAFAYWWGSHQVIKGENTQMQFFIILVVMLISAQLWGQAFILAPEISRARAATSQLLSLIICQSGKDEYFGDVDPDRERDNRDNDIEKFGESASDVSNLGRGASISFQSVSFSYPSSSNTKVLEDISFEIQPGQLCGLVGPSGAGKSTIINLLQNMYQPVCGNVLIDGVSVSDRDFRNDIAIVPQENALFSGTIKFNVGLGARSDHDATDEEIENACKLANIHDTIMGLPEGYDSECGPSGTHLSGGQRQRLAIARALVRKPRLLILDESTSALDSQTELALQEGLESMVRESGITVVAITHRVHTVRKAHIILVVEGERRSQARSNGNKGGNVNGVVEHGDAVSVELGESVVSAAAAAASVAEAAAEEVAATLSARMALLDSEDVIVWGKDEELGRSDGNIDVYSICRAQDLGKFDNRCYTLGTKYINTLEVHGPWDDMGITHVEFPLGYRE
ncbi:hypothetical protein DV736_g4122, partial [Chaetothyriales sp. CBS 134916]